MGAPQILISTEPSPPEGFWSSPCGTVKPTKHQTRGLGAEAGRTTTPGMPGAAERACAPVGAVSQAHPRVVLVALQAARARPQPGRRRPPAVAMLPASLLRRPGLGRLVRHVRAYAEAAAAPAPTAAPGQMSFTFASPTQVRTPGRTPDSRPFPVWSGSEPPNPAPDPGS